jgi:hypothetical protein
VIGANVLPLLREQHEALLLFNHAERDGTELGAVLKARNTSRVD